MAGLNGLGGDVGSWTSAASSSTSGNKVWDWAAIGTAALQAVGSMQASSSARASSKEDWAARLEEMRMQIAGQRDLASQARGYQLQDRAWNREQVENYRQFYTGTPSAEQPKPISTEVVNTPQTPGLAVKPPAATPATPAKPAKKPKKRNFLSRLFG